MDKVAHAVEKAAKEKVKGALKDLPNSLAKHAHDYINRKLEEQVEKGLKTCNTSGERANLLAKVKALQALNYGKFAHNLVHSLSSQRRALEDIHKPGGNKRKESEAFQKASSDVVKAFTDLAKGANKYSNMRQRVEVGCKPDINANFGLDFRFHLPKSDFEQLRRETPRAQPGIRLTPFGIQLNLQLGGNPATPSLDIRERPASSPLVA